MENFQDAVEDFLEEYKHRNNDFIFLVNQELKPNEDFKPGYISLENKIKLSMNIIFDNHIKFKLDE